MSTAPTSSSIATMSCSPARAPATTRLEELAASATESVRVVRRKLKTPIALVF